MYIAKDTVPIYTVEKPGFINMVKVFDPRYELPSRKYFSKLPCLSYIIAHDETMHSLLHPRKR